MKSHSVLMGLFLLVIPVFAFGADSPQEVLERVHKRYDQLDDGEIKILTAAPEDYSATLIGREKAAHGEAIILKLVPRSTTSLVKSMKLWVNDADWLIHRVEIVDQHGKETSYQVISFKTNIGISDSRFLYAVPAGVEVVDLRD